MQGRENGPGTLIPYDASGIPLTITYYDETYYYITKLQGDVIGIADSTGALVVRYSYDAWGKLLSITGSMASTLGVQNPLRYRGYVYDQETGLYYLQSRYYDPEIGRFINADALVATGQGLLGNNMFAYCNNNTVNGCDPCGTCFHNRSFENCEECQEKLDNLVSTISNTWNAAIAWCADTYNRINNINQQQTMLETQIIIQQNEMVADAAEAIWDAYMWSYNQQQEATTAQAIATNDFIADRFSTPEKASNTMNGIGIAVDALAIYVGVACGPIPGAIIGGIGLAFTAIAWGINVANEE